jgi:ketosteroid isomerase-like protein
MTDRPDGAAARRSRAPSHASTQAGLGQRRRQKRRVAAHRATAPERSTASPGIDDWLVRFEAAVRASDFEAGRTLFAPDAVAFGTRTEMARGIDAIVAEQWRHVWPHIHDFRLGARVTRIGDDTGWVATMWQTTRPEAGVSLTARPGRGTFVPEAGASRTARRGRGTFVLERRDGQWLAVHSHFSLIPEDPRL